MQVEKIFIQEYLVGSLINASFEVLIYYKVNQNL